MYQIQDSLQLLHVRLSNLLARGNHLHIHILSLKGEVCVLKCMYQVSGHVYLC
jgi:hypothetical protein